MTFFTGATNTYGIHAVVDPGVRPGGGGHPPPLTLDQTEVWGAEKNFVWDWAPPLSQGLDDRPPSLLIWRSGSATVHVPLVCPY